MWSLARKSGRQCLLLYVVALVLAACGSVSDQNDQSDLANGEGPEFSPVRAFAGNCAFVEAPGEGKALPLVGTVIAALAEPAVRVLFSSVKSAVRSAAAPEEKSVSAATSFFANRFGAVPVSDDAAEHYPFPKCYQIISGSISETRNSYRAGETEVVDAAFPEKILAIHSDRSRPNAFTGQRIEKVLYDNGIFLTEVPDLFVELYLNGAPNSEFMTFSVTMIAYRKVIGTRRFGLFDDGGNRDLAITLQISGADESAGGVKGEAASIVLSNLRPGTVQRIDPRVIESKWIRVDPTNAPAARVAEITITESRDGNAFLQKVSEVLEQVSAEDEQRVVDAAVELIDPEARAEATRKLEEAQLAERQELVSSIVGLYEKRNSADQKISGYKALQGGSVERRTAAIAALGEMLQVNIEARRLNQPSLSYKPSEIADAERAARSSSGAPRPVNPN